MREGFKCILFTLVSSFNLEFFDDYFYFGKRFIIYALFQLFSKFICNNDHNLILLIIISNYEVTKNEYFQWFQDDSSLTSDALRSILDDLEKRSIFLHSFFLSRYQSNSIEEKLDARMCRAC